MTYTFFDAPIGTPDERASDQLWPGHWVDATGYAALYFNPNTGKNEYHTGSDLNLNFPHYDADKLASVYAAGDGVVKFAGALPVWGNVIVILHANAKDFPIWTRYAHVNDWSVKVDQVVQRGDEIAHIGNAFGRVAYHLHFDMCKLDLGMKPADWPGSDLSRVTAHYLDPLKTIAGYRLIAVPPAPVAPLDPAIAAHITEAEAEQATLHNGGMPA